MAEAKTVRPKIGIGYRVGKLTVVERTPEKRGGYSVWRCKCDCGGEICLDTRYLQRGTVTSCGCAPRPKIKNDLTGRRFGRLVCLEPTEERTSDGKIIWRCRCDCGKECLAPSTQLTNGYKKSCGCLGHPPLKDFVGRRFGMLTVLEYAGKWGGKHRWRCRCDCGKETVADQTMLQTGHTQSCGCRKTRQLRENLKLTEGTSVTILESLQKRTISTNRSGHTGVYRNQRTGKWEAQITFKNRCYHLGSFARKEDAVKARQRGEEMHTDFLEAYYQEHSSETR